MSDLPKDFTVTMDLQMRQYLEKFECDWIKDKGLPAGITPKMAEAWFRLNGYIRDKRKPLGWRKPVVRREGDEE